MSIGMRAEMRTPPLGRARRPATTPARLDDEHFVRGVHAEHRHNPERGLVLTPTPRSTDVCSMRPYTGACQPTPCPSPPISRSRVPWDTANSTRCPGVCRTARRPAACTVHPGSRCQCTCTSWVPLPDKQVGDDQQIAVGGQDVPAMLERSVAVVRRLEVVEARLVRQACAVPCAVCDQWNGPRRHRLRSVVDRQRVVEQRSTGTDRAAPGRRCTSRSPDRSAAECPDAEASATARRRGHDRRSGSRAVRASMTR